MSSAHTAPRSAVELIADYLVTRVDAHRQAWRAEYPGIRAPPLVCAIQGPQGSGKSYTASKLPALLSSSSSAPIRTVSLSLDELYLPHTQLQAVAASDPGNALLAGRGQAGTHDLALAQSVLAALKHPVQPDSDSASAPSTSVAIPVFDKSLHGGEGDRLPRSEWVEVDRPCEVDLVVFEGWMNGFRALDPPSRLRKVYTAAQANPASAETQAQLGIDYAPPFLLHHAVDHLETVQRHLEAYRPLWDAVDVFVQIKPERMGFVWEWRLEQEHNMKAQNGGVGMTDEQVKHFIARYMPGYELWLRGIDRPDTTWRGNGLKVVIDKQRDVVGVEHF